MSTNTRAAKIMTLTCAATGVGPAFALYCCCFSILYLPILRYTPKSVSLIHERADEIFSSSIHGIAWKFNSL